MSDIHYRWRAYDAGDETAINDLYLRITGRTRTSEQWAWQWQQAPGGTGDIWLIEAVHPDGCVELIGHHGIMPVRFTLGPTDLLFGKTENTMVLPEYRKRILYPRYEQRFAARYEPRYHALFSTMGPAEAIRQREALGYTASHSWMRLEKSSYVWRVFARVLARFPNGCPERAIKALVRSSPNTKLPSGVDILTNREARSNSFMRNYWKHARNSWGVSPRRDVEDLAWRYWNNPYTEYYAVIVQNLQVGSGVGIAMQGPNAGHWVLVDFSIEKPCAKLFEYALNAVAQGLRKRFGCKIISFSFTDDSVSGFYMSTVQQAFGERSVRGQKHAVNRTSARYMPRKVTSKGAAIAGLTLGGWDITGAVFEGRA